MLRRLALEDFRNYRALELAPASGLNVLVGSNAQGKSNLLEAIAMLGTGRSFRTSREGELVREGTGRARVAGEASLPGGTVRLSCDLTLTPGGTRKTYAVNGSPVRFGGYLGRARVVTFVPSDLAIVRGGPAARRALLNGALAQSVRGYYRHLVRYGKITAQKSALLRGAIGSDRELLAAYNDELLGDAAAIIGARAAYVAELARAGGEAYAAIAGESAERLAITYAPNVGTADGDEATIREAVRAKLERAADAETARRSVLVGPHRDDLQLTIDGRPLAAFGSQGQYRTATLALKIAEYAVVRQRSGDAPLLLLDDVLSELDRNRASRLLCAVGDFEQAFLTATELESAKAPRGTRFAVHAATVSAC